MWSRNPTLSLAEGDLFLRLPTFAMNDRTIKRARLLQPPSNSVPPPHLHPYPFGEPGIATESPVIRPNPPADPENIREAGTYPAQPSSWLTPALPFVRPKGYGVRLGRFQPQGGPVTCLLHGHRNVCLVRIAAQRRRNRNAVLARRRCAGADVDLIAGTQAGGQSKQPKRAEERAPAAAASSEANRQ